MPIHDPCALLSRAESVRCREMPARSDEQLSQVFLMKAEMQPQAQHQEPGQIEP